jgi:putative hydrolase of the HAD superfamily
MKTKAVLFDLGDTLTTPWILEDALRKILSSAGIHRSIEQIKEAIARAGKDLLVDHECTYGEVSYKKYWDAWRLHVLKHLGLHADENLLKTVETKWSDYIECEAYSDAGETLIKLRKTGLKTGLISTAYEEDVHAILRKAGLQEQLFDVILGANATVAMKPSPRAFQHALKKLCVKPEEALFVGDNVETDYRAAEKAGMKAVLIQRVKNKASKAGVPKMIISLEEIFKYID